MPRQRQIASDGWKIVQSVVAKRIKIKVIRTKYYQDEGSGNKPLTKAQAQAVRDLIRSKLFNNDENITKLSSEVKALSRRAIYSEEVHRKELLKETEAAKLDSFKRSLGIFAGAGSLLLGAVTMAVMMQH